MGNRYYARLAADNIKKNAKVYVPYIITSVLMTAMIYIICSLSVNPDFENFKRGRNALPVIMTFGSYVTEIFAFIFLFYSSSFIMKRRRKEFGLLNILGMEKRHIAKLLLIESGYVVLMTFVFGLGTGVLLDKLMFLTLTKMVGETATLGFHISVQSLVITAAVMLFTFFVIYLNMLRQIHLSKPVELLAGSSVGEKEPKTKLIMTFLGLALLGTGYTISIVTEEPTKTLPLFLLAVLCVIFGTYLLFIAGSIALLKLLKKNKRFYYKSNHFTAVSGLIYRMKRNAVGLASVCILSTMVLVMVSVTSSMMIGLDPMIDKEYPCDVYMRVHTVSSGDKFEKLFSEKMEIKNIRRTSELLLDVYGDFASPKTLTESDYELVTYPGGEQKYAVKDRDYYNITVYDSKRIDRLFDEGSRLSKESFDVDKGEIIILTTIPNFDPESFTLAGKTYKVAKTVFDTPKTPNTADLGYTIIMNSREEMLELVNAYNEHSFREAMGGEYLEFDYVSSDKLAQNELLDQIFGENYDADTYGNVYYLFRTDEKAGALEIFGGLFFLGLFLGTLFLIETILIIYYKQISEGYEDQKRFEIMQDVGMSRHEVKRSIRSQILLVFFLPLIAAGCHVTFAFPLIKRMLALVGLTDTGLYLMCAVGSFALFAVLYAVIYAITAKTYYKIVRK